MSSVAMPNVAYAPLPAQAPFIPATSIDLRKPSKNDLLRILYQRAINGIASISLEELAAALRVCMKTIQRWRDELIADGKLTILPRWFHRQRVYRVDSPPSKPPSSEKMSNDMSNDKSPVFSDFRHFNIESIERRHETTKSAPDLWLRFREAMKQATGQTLSNLQIGVICRELKRQGMNLWQFWQGLAHHPIHRARDLGKLLFTIARNRLQWPAKPKPAPKETKVEQMRRQYEAQICLGCLSRTCKCEGRTA